MDALLRRPLATDIFRDCREQLAKGARRLAVLGDLNTM